MLVMTMPTPISMPPFRVMGMKRSDVMRARSAVILPSAVPRAMNA